MSRHPSPLPPTQTCYSELQAAYQFFNRKLFGGELPEALLTLQRAKMVMGYFAADRFADLSGNRVSEIAMNPVFFANRPIEYILSTLVHEQCHLWRHVSFEKPSRRSYHDKLWAGKMKAVGLKPTTTGRPDGKEVGEKVDHIIIADGPFMTACSELLQTDFRITWYDRFPATAQESEFGYVTAADPESGGEKGYIVVAPKGKVGALPADGLGAFGCIGGGEPVELVISLNDPADAGAPASLPMNIQAPPPSLSLAPPPKGLDVVAAKKKDPMTDKTVRWRYTCPSCGTKVWGKHNLAIRCGTCTGYPLMTYSNGVTDGEQDGE